MFDTEAFIFLVQNQPSIWNISSKNYGDRDERNLAWEAVAKSMFTNEWNHLSIAEKNVKKEDLKKKWKNLRDNYIKFNTQKIKKKSAKKQKKRYVYADIMSFLPSVSQKRRATGDMSSLQENQTHNDVEEIIKEEMQISETSELVDQVDQTLVPTVFKTAGNNLSSFQENQTHSDVEVNVKDEMPTGETTELFEQVGQTVVPIPAKPPSTQKKKTCTNNFQDMLLEVLRNPPKPNIDYIDPDQAFLLSLLPHIKKLNDDQKLELRYQFLQSIRSISSYTYQTPLIQSQQQSQLNNNWHTSGGSSTHSIDSRTDLSPSYEQTNN